MGRTYDPDVEPDGVLCPPEPDPMLGQFLVEPEPEPELELPELDEPLLELLEPELVPPDPEVPVLPVLEPVLDDGVLVEELEVELVLGVELDVVAALATNALPARRPVVNAPTASTFRKRSCMEGMPFVSGATPPFGGSAQRAPPTCGRPQSELGECVELPCESMTILRKRWSRTPCSELGPM